ncbi:MAG: hypothetical protein EAY75_00470 [Bacteroidetes bacterium]|nr:MAG: hypothetical protein EAY75_00470 [Bacteroidota bacterium]
MQFQYPNGTSIPPGAVQVVGVPKCLRFNRPTANVDSFLVLPQFSPIKKSAAFVVSVWVRGENGCAAAIAQGAGVGVGFDGQTPTALVATGVPIEGWQRLEATIAGVPPTASALKMHFIPVGSALFVDDIRIHPFNASMKSFVYNPLNLRLMAELDENNYASLYEYDEDGTLVRVKKETERGIQTIKETRNAMAK